MTIEELQKQVSDLTSKLDNYEDEKQSLIDKNKELIKEKRNLKSKYEDVDMEEYSKVLAENEELKSNLTKLEKDYNSTNETLTAKDGYLQKVLVNDGLTKALLDAGVPKEFLEPAMAMLKPNAKVEQKEDGYTALIDGKEVAEYTKDWFDNGAGKVFQMGVQNSGGGAGGNSNHNANSGDSRFFEKGNAEFSLTKQAEIYKENPDLYKQLKG